MTHRIKPPLQATLVAALFFAAGACCWGAEETDLFSVPGIKALPLDMEILSEQVTNGVRTIEFFMAGASFNGKPTKIYAFYSRPERPGKYPAVLELHGAGLFKLIPDVGINYASNGFCCLTIDWWGPDANGKPPREPPRQPPFSIVDHPGFMCGPTMNRDGSVVPNRRSLYGVDVDGFRNGVLFARRAVMFLQSRPEVDQDRLCISGGSAGAYLTLLVLGVEPAFKAAAVKYGCGFITMPGYRLGGLFVPMTLCSKEEQDTWAAGLDPRYRLDRIKANTLMLSGTDDHFFWMPMVLQTYRSMNNPKRLVMEANDNHSLAGDWHVPLKYFQSVCGVAPQWPVIEPLSASKKEGAIVLKVKASAAAGIAKVSLWVKRMPLATFKFKRDIHTPIGSIEPWREVAAAESEGAWQASIPVPAEGEQVVVYAMIEDNVGAKASSDTVEIPDYPRWREQAVP